MTTIAMGAGMMPIALGWAGDPSFRAPMAFVVIGGLLTSTLLSLLVIPVVYSYVDDIGNILGRFKLPQTTQRKHRSRNCHETDRKNPREPDNGTP
ncbi:hypothetical protein HORIV_12750 [Vreelandella olivaria]|uniref:Uncharacterized protein n=1 Tax=Vreelandella olivaria TaxID=390919 RepID=A0ABM7GEC9_9GAMM|nr:hypothetical protein HORIV_12750 [Halomonas olivaria]